MTPYQILPITGVEDRPSPLGFIKKCFFPKREDPCEAPIPERAQPQRASDGPNLKMIIDELAIEPGQSILDLGCGAGSAILTLAHYPFARVDGVEVSADLAGTATCNLALMRVHNATVHVMDVSEFENYDQYSFIHIYSSFAAATMDAILKNLQASIARRPRTVTIISREPDCETAVLAAGFEKTCESRGLPSFAIFRYR